MALREAVAPQESSPGLNLREPTKCQAISHGDIGAPDGSACLDLAAVHLALNAYEGIPGMLHLCSTADMAGRRFPTDRAGIERAAEYVRDLDAQGVAGIYHRGTTVRADAPSSGRGRAEHTHMWLRVQVDADHGKPGYAPDAATVRALIDRARLPEPTEIVDSGHGLYPRWEIVPAVPDSPNVRALVRDVQAELRATFAAAGYGLDDCTDAARVWRLPGTVNGKVPDEPVPCRVIERSGAVYTFGELRARTPVREPEPPAPATSSPAGASSRDRRFTDRQAWDYIERYGLGPLRAAQVGERNIRLNVAAVVVGHFVREFLPDEETARAALRDALAATGYDDPAAAEATITSGLREGMREPYTRVQAPDLAAAPVGAVSAPAEAATEARADPLGSWRPRDLSAALNGTKERAEPTVGVARIDGPRFLYRGKEHACFGETESGKSWFALACAAAELDAGHRVLYVHFEEEDEADTITRLLLLGVSKSRILAGFDFVGPTSRITPAVVEHFAALPPSLVILDGQNEAMALHGDRIMEPDGVAAYRRKLVTPFTAMGAAVLSLDHVVKDPERRGEGYSLGSIHKINGLSGVGILLENEEPFGQGRRGASRVYVTKDRPGQVRRHGKPTKVARKFFMGVMSVDARHDGPVALDVWAPSEDATPAALESAERARDEEVWTAVAGIVASGATATLRAVEAAARGRKGDVAVSLERLKLAGRLTESTGPRNARVFTPTVTVPQDQELIESD